MDHIWTILILKILQAHLLLAFVANLKIGAIYALYPDSFCDNNLAARKVFALSDSGYIIGREHIYTQDESTKDWIGMGTSLLE